MAEIVRGRILDDGFIDPRPEAVYGCAVGDLSVSVCHAESYGILIVLKREVDPKGGAIGTG
jgi:hypothetical protein